MPLRPPEAAAPSRVPVSAASSAASQNVAAGTSLMGAARVHWSTTGLAATITAPEMPVAVPNTRRPSTAVNTTNSAAQTGTM